MNEHRKLSHFLGPVYNKKSKILILGTFPSDKSRESGFFYGHPQNRFWRVIAAVFECETPNNIEEKRHMLLQNGIALWDVIESCEIVGSSDSSIRNVVPANVGQVLNACEIKKIYANGKTAEKLYRRYHQDKIGRKITALPSTSPANAVYSLEKLINVWMQIRVD